MGERHAFRRRVVKHHLNGQPFRRNELRPPEEWIELPEGTFPPLVSTDDFEIAKKRLVTNRDRLLRPNRDPEADLLRGGFVKSGYRGCLAQVWWTRKRPGFGCARSSAVRHGCPLHNIKVGELDAAVWRRVEAILTQPEMIERELTRLRENDPTTATWPASTARSRTSTGAGPT